MIIELTRIKFWEFLTYLAPDFKVGQVSSDRSCPITSFVFSELGNVYDYVVETTPTEVRVLRANPDERMQTRITQRDLPLWARKFVERLDLAFPRGQVVTAADCLKVLATIK